MRTEENQFGILFPMYPYTLPNNKKTLSGRRGKLRKMDPSFKSAVVEWQEEGYPLGLISLKSIQEPRLAFDAYVEDQEVKAKCQGFPGLHPAKLLKISGK